MRMKSIITILKTVLQFNMQQKLAGVDVGTLLNPQLVGDPGIGKTAAPQQVAKMLGWNFRSVIVAQYDAGEMAGMPYLGEDEDGNPVYKRARPDWLPTDEDGPTLLLLDEVSQAPMANLNILAQLAN